MALRPIHAVGSITAGGGMDNADGELQVLKRELQHKTERLTFYENHCADLTQDLQVDGNNGKR